MKEKVNLALILRILIGFWFMYTAQIKIMDSMGFANAIRAYDILPSTMTNLPAIIFPWIELTLGVCLVSGLFVTTTAELSMGMVALFTINVIIAIFRGMDIDCGCGSSLIGVERVGWLKVLENSAVIVALYIIKRTKKHAYAIDNTI